MSRLLLPIKSYIHMYNLLKLKYDYSHLLCDDIGDDNMMCVGLN